MEAQPGLGVALPQALADHMPLEPSQVLNVLLPFAASRRRPIAPLPLIGTSAIWFVGNALGRSDHRPICCGCAAA